MSFFFQNASKHRDKREWRSARSVENAQPDTNKNLENKVCTLKLTTDHTVWKHVMQKNSQVYRTQFKLHFKTGCGGTSDIIELCGEYNLISHAVTCLFYT